MNERSHTKRQAKPIDVKHCAGCRDDFYNGKNGLGVSSCWMRDTATLVPRILIHVDQPPPYKGMKAEKRPDCYKRPRFVSVSPDRIGKDGYWK